jgi:hemolysin III
MYGASTAYHTFDLSDIGNKRLKKIDHMMISVMIAGSYTPICVLVLDKPAGTILLVVIWCFAIAGIVLKVFWVTCPRWVSSVLYLAMGWACVFAIPMILRLLPLGGFLWLLFGGLSYTAGGIIYALKLPLLEKHFKDFGAHELFHVFVMGGTFCHYMMMYLYVA